MDIGRIKTEKVFQTAVPLEYQKGFSKKRIDHRHHAMDAIVIAGATRNYVNHLNNESASRNAKTREALSGIIVNLKQNLRIINKTTISINILMQMGHVFMRNRKSVIVIIRKLMQ